MVSAEVDTAKAATACAFDFNHIVSLLTNSKTLVTLTGSAVNGGVVEGKLREEYDTSVTLESLLSNSTKRTYSRGTVSVDVCRRFNITVEMFALHNSQFASTAHYSLLIN